MNTVAYTSPFVPPEWVAAHGLRPQWMRLRSAVGRARAGVSRGTCPYAGAWVDAVGPGAQLAAVVAATTCDQMRYAAARVQRAGDPPVFLMNVPSTWQTAAAQQLYREELRRLGRFVVRFGGRSPSPEELARVMLKYDSARLAVRTVRPGMSARQVSQVMVELREGGEPAIDRNAFSPQGAGVPLALVGSPLFEDDGAFLDLIEGAGGRVVLDATEGGERTLPRPFDSQSLRNDPFEELADAYFGSIPDVFRRPNHRLHDWLDQEMKARGVRGVLLRRYVWCDLWHAEVQRLKARSPVPVLEIDVDGQQAGAAARTLGRIEVFLETLE